MPAVPVADNWEAWPFYIVCDVSSSMHDHKFSEYWGSEVSPWRRLFSATREVVSELSDNEDVRQQVHLSVVEFADRAETILKLTRLDQEGPLVPNFSKGGRSDFAAVWKHLARLIPEDQKELASTGFKSRRPTIFFITDGKPDLGEENRKQTTNDWKQYVYAMRRAIGDERLYPRIIAIGLGGMSNESVLWELHSKSPHGAAVIVNDASIIRQIIEQIIVNPIEDSDEDSEVEATIEQIIGQIIVNPIEDSDEDSAEDSDEDDEDSDGKD
ncbi:vWA domain-containing protein [Actinomyces sp. oral taxon 414]|uniref:vWA domain-containing protein n=1 Tax=Actinomyces sp. oral taxon 414 TaxID=712122 RepID=UPI000A877FC2|nr:VWA domain-containing protein [Actinomyces sp. oral taxon 414]